MALELGMVYRPSNIVIFQESPETQALFMFTKMPIWLPVGGHIVFPWASVCLSFTNRVCSITWKPLKLYSENLIQISISMRWRADCKNGYCLLYFLSYFPWNFVHHKNRVCSNLKSFSESSLVAYEIKGNWAQSTMKANMLSLHTPTTPGVGSNGHFFLF